MNPNSQAKQEKRHFLVQHKKWGWLCTRCGNSEKSFEVLEDKPCFPLPDIEILEADAKGSKEAVTTPRPKHTRNDAELAQLEELAELQRELKHLEALGLEQQLKELEKYEQQLMEMERTEEEVLQQALAESAAEAEARDHEEQQIHVLAEAMQAKLHIDAPAEAKHAEQDLDAPAEVKQAERVLVTTAEVEPADQDLEPVLAEFLKKIWQAAEDVGASTEVKQVEQDLHALAEAKQAEQDLHEPAVAKRAEQDLKAPAEAKRAEQDLQAPAEANRAEHNLHAPAEAKRAEQDVVTPQLQVCKVLPGRSSSQHRSRSREQSAWQYSQSPGCFTLVSEHVVISGLSLYIVIPCSPGPDMMDTLVIPEPDTLVIPEPEVGHDAVAALQYSRTLKMPIDVEEEPRPKDEAMPPEAEACVFEKGEAAENEACSDEEGEEEPHEIDVAVEVDGADSKDPKPKPGPDSPEKATMFYDVKDEKLPACPVQSPHEPMTPAEQALLTNAKRGSGKGRGRGRGCGKVPAQTKPRGGGKAGGRGRGLKSAKTSKMREASQQNQKPLQKTQRQSPRRHQSPS